MPNLSILLLLLLTVFFSCHSPASESAETDLREATAGTTSTRVNYAVARDTLFTYLISVNGRIKSFRDHGFAAPNGIKLVKFSGTPGKAYSEGSAIAQFDIIAFQNRLDRAELDQFNAEKEYQSQLLGYENLLKGMTDAQAEGIRRKLKISTGLLRAEQDIKEARYDLSIATIRAPFTGVLANISVKEGELLTAGKEMFRLYDPGQLGLEVKVLESDITLIKKGMPATVSPLSEPSVSYNAHVEEINPYVDENGMVTVVLGINQAAKERMQVQLFPGMNCTGSIYIPGNRALLVPKEAVVQRNDRAVVFTLENGKAKWHYVVTGRDNGKDIEVREGLINGQKVITSNNLQLAHDAPVLGISVQ